ncbi:MAG: two-component regulator propeller domain-containing protein [Bacteroidota bacterium]
MHKALSISFVVLFSLGAFCQKYNFVNWTVEDGLIQSQASSICQDQYRQLWIGTEGGISKFDGKKFTGYSVQDGLIANPVNVLFCDKKGNIWAGTNYGMSFFDGTRFTNFKLSNNPVNNITAIAQDRNENIYTLNNYKLYRFKNAGAEKITVSGDSTEKVTSLYLSSAEELMAFVAGKGLYVYRQNKWLAVLITTEVLKQKGIYAIFVTSGGDTLLAGRPGLYKVKNNRVTEYRNDRKDLQESVILCFAEDSRKNTWLGADNGIYKLDHETVSHFDAKNGFTDNSVNCIYNDAENNLWFATDADGIYKFRENTFTYYDKSSGLSNTIIMGVAQSSSGRVYAAGYGGGIYYINTKNSIESVDNAPELANVKINCLYADDADNLWIGTLSKGAWRYNEKTGLKKVSAKNDPELLIRGATCFLKNSKGDMLIGGNQGLFVFDKDENLVKIKMDNVLITTLRQFDRDSVLIGSSKGIYTLDKNNRASLLNSKALMDASVLCLEKNEDNIWVGTIDKGVLNWNVRTGRLISYNTSNGLPSNFIYSIEASEKQKAWIGTGFGISNLKLDRYNNVEAVKNYGLSDGLLGMECSHNGVLKAADSSLWFGTTKGLFHFNPSTDIADKNQPVVLLKSVRLFSSPITDSNLFKGRSPWFNLPQNLTLGSTQNHLTFELGAIYFTNPEDLLYKYQLEGIDKNFTTSGNPFIIYPALPPGLYTLRVSGITKNGIPSINSIEYRFRIEKAFYQTRFFQLFVVLSLITTGALITYVFTRGRQKRKQKAKETLEKIREEEFIKLRQRTAEDFHDEMGNSLTRISVLTDVLRSKINKGETEITKLVSQIKENTAILYNGSRDIIWSLNSQNDGMYEIAEHIKEIGAELFLETPVDFYYSHNIRSTDEHKLKLDYSRNLTMIFKEAYSNILKHAGAGKAIVSLYLDADYQLEINIADDGKGFDTALAGNGNGIRNMTNRVKRLNGKININTAPDKGTEIKIILKNIFA